MIKPQVCHFDQFYALELFVGKSLYTVVTVHFHIICGIINHIVAPYERGIHMQNSQYQKTIKDICRFARENDNEISRFSIADILQMEYPGITEPEINKIVQNITDTGIRVRTNTDEDYPADSVDSTDFYPANVNISQTNLSVSNVIDRLRHDEFLLKPDFQREGDLWSPEKQSRLIESLMLRIPLPAFYFDATKEGFWEVIDGQQRLTAFKNYIAGEEIGEDKETGEPRYGNLKPFKGMQYLRDFNGKTFDQIPRQYIRRVKEANLIAYTVNRGTPEKIIYNIFQRINTGGMNLEPQEIRHSLYQGRSTKMIEQMAKMPSFRSATQYSLSSDRMMDREYALRYIAFTEMDYEKNYKGNIDDYLILTMKNINKANDDKEKQIFAEFERTMDICHNTFGRFAFRRYTKNDKKYRRGPINKALFEVWSVCFKNLPDDDVSLICNKRDKFIEDYAAVLSDSRYGLALKAGDESSVKRRMDMTKTFLRRFLHANKTQTS